MAIWQAMIVKGAVLPAAYIRIDRVFGGKAEGWSSLISIYASKESAEIEEPLKQINMSVPFNPEIMNPFKLLYDAMKLNPDFAKAEDC